MKKSFGAARFYYIFDNLRFGSLQQQHVFAPHLTLSTETFCLRRSVRYSMLLKTHNPSDLLYSANLLQLFQIFVKFRFMADGF